MQASTLYSTYDAIIYYSQYKEGKMTANLATTRERERESSLFHLRKMRVLILALVLLAAIATSACFYGALSAQAAESPTTKIGYL